MDEPNTVFVSFHWDDCMRDNICIGVFLTLEDAMLADGADSIEEWQLGATEQTSELVKGCKGEWS